MLVYIEYISRLPTASLEQFHFAALGQQKWSGEYDEDRLVLNLGRTMRLGPDPGYIAAWYNPNAGLERLGDWIEIFRSGEADDLEEPFKMAARIDVAGCYEPLLEPVLGRDGEPYVGEYFDLANGASLDAVRAFYEERRAAHPDFELNLLVDRIGSLGPDPRGLAIWSVGSYGRLHELARDLDGADGPVRLVTTGVYADLGREIL